MTFIQKRRLHKVKRVLKKMLLYVSFSLMSFALIFCLGFNAFCVQNAMADAVNGGGLYVGKSSTLNYEGKRNLSGFIASSNGGGIYNIGTLNLNGGTVSANKANSYGGGVFSDGTFTMNGGTISDNEALYGGGLAFTSGTGTMNAGSISGNKSEDGAGIHATGGTFTLVDGSITGNTSSDMGGGIYISPDGKFVFKKGSISGNSAKYGGAIYIDSGSFTMSDGTISGNTATNQGSGFYLTSTGTFTMNGGTISGNTCSGAGGGAYVNAGTFTMNGGTISGNTATTGAGVYVKSTFKMNGGSVVNNTCSSSIYNIYGYRGATVYLYGGTANGIIGGNGTIYIKRAFDFGGTYNLKSYGSLVLEDYNGTTPKLNLVVEEREGTFLTFQGSTTAPNMSNITISGYDSNSYEITKTLSGTTWTFKMSKKVVPGLFTKTWRDEVSSILSLSSFDNVERIQFRYLNSVDAQGSDFYCPHQTDYSSYGIMTTGIKVVSCQNKDCIIFVYNKQIIADMNMESAFADLNVESIIFENFDTSKTENMAGMFYRCRNLTRLDLSSFKTKEVQSFEAMFQDCNGLQSLDLSKFNMIGTADVTGMLNFKTTGLQYLYTPAETNGLSIQIGKTATPMYDAVANNTDMSFNKTYSVLPSGEEGSRTYVETALKANLSNQGVLEDNKNILINCIKDILNNSSFSGVKIHVKFAFEAPVFYHNVTNGNGNVKIYMHKRGDVVYFTVVNPELFVIANDAGGMFAADTDSCFEKVSYYTFQNFFTGYTTSMKGMFLGSTSLERIYGFQNFHTEQVREAQGMFYGSGIKSLGFYKLKFDNLSNASQMFYYCADIISLNMSYVDLSHMSSGFDDMFLFNGGNSSLPIALQYFATPFNNAQTMALGVPTPFINEDTGEEVSHLNANLQSSLSLRRDVSTFRDNNKTSSSNLEKLDLWAGYSALTFVYVSAIAYPGIEWKRRKEKNIKK